MHAERALLMGFSARVDFLVMSETKSVYIDRQSMYSITYFYTSMDTEHHQMK
jgi:hypothetical protein